MHEIKSNWRVELFALCPHCGKLSVTKSFVEEASINLNGAKMSPATVIKAKWFIDFRESRNF